MPCHKQTFREDRARGHADMTTDKARICGHKNDGQQACLPAGRGPGKMLPACARPPSESGHVPKALLIFPLSVLAVRQ